MTDHNAVFALISRNKNSNEKKCFLTNIEEIRSSSKQKINTTKNV